MSRPGTPLRGFALCRSIVEDEHFPSLTATTQRALLVVAIRHADHDGWFEIKYSTIAAELGCDVRNAGVAMRKAVPLFLEQTHQRRADGSRRACAFRLVERVTTQADEIVRLWVSQRDENVRPPKRGRNRPPAPARTKSSEQERLLNGHLTVLPGEPEKPSLEEVEAVQTMLRERGLLAQVPTL